MADSTEPFRTIAREYAISQASRLSADAFADAVVAEVEALGAPAVYIPSLFRVWETAWQDGYQHSADAVMYG